MLQFAMYILLPFPANILRIAQAFLRQTLNCAKYSTFILRPFTAGYTGKHKKLAKT